MENNQNEYDKIEKTNNKSFIKSQVILNKAISSIKEEKKNSSPKRARNITLLRTRNLTLLQQLKLQKEIPYKIKKFNKKYKSRFNSILYLLNKDKAKYKKYNDTVSKYLKNRIAQNIYIFKFYLTSQIVGKSLKIPNFIRFILYTLKVFTAKIQNLSAKIFKKLIKLFPINQRSKTSQSKLEKIVISIWESINSFTKLLNCLGRLCAALVIYFLPFTFLAHQALIPFIPGYQELVINSFPGLVFERIPYLANIITLFHPIIGSFNRMFQFWTLLAYFLIFPIGYRSLKLPYKLGYNGTIAYTFLLVNSSLGFGQEIIIPFYETVKMIKDVNFLPYLVRLVRRTMYREIAIVKIFADLIIRYELQTRRNYCYLLIFIKHCVLSPLAFISLAALVYNCLYYIIYNKNPKIPLITEASLSTIKYPQKEE